ncbi:MAG: hypothetical protein QW804_05545 [Candidatus Bathyarchaeia archaeon]|nr:hypothetical protein [Candidatus Bathyarchaeota archaeon]
MKHSIVKILMPFLISLGGILLDYWTTSIGLSMGFIEIHPEYHPLKALAIFWSAITVLVATLPRTRFWRMSINALAALPYLGAINNVLVIAGIFPGLPI